MNPSDFPLVLFTVLAQTSVGLVLVSTVRQFAANGPAGQVRKEWIVALAVLCLGLLLSLFHLGHPARAYEALKHLSTSWLSREALTSGLVLILVTVGVFQAGSKGGNRFIGAFAALMGMVLLFVMGMTYSPPSFPALNNALPFLFFCVTAVVVGASLAGLFTAREHRPLVRQILMVGCIVGLVLHLAAPCIWLSGGAVMAATATAWLASPLYWIAILAAYVVPLAVLAALRDIPAWLPLCILVGELLGRMVFFDNTLHTALFIGGVY
jgi:DMSO reductase anchor subunit